MEDHHVFEKALDCVRCGSCRVIYASRTQSMRFGKQCPPGTHYLVESFYPAGLMYLAVGLMREQFPYSQRGVEAVYSCTLCKYCMTICEEFVETQTLPVIEALRSKAVREGVGPLPPQKACIEKLVSSDNILGVSRERRGEWLKKVNGQAKNLAEGERASVLYFVGCQYSCNESLADVPVATAEILNAAGIDWGVLAGEERCCGYMALALGYRDIFERYARENSDVMNRLGVETVVTSCPECYYTLKTRYPDVAPLNVEVLHTTELFHRLIGEGSVKLKENSVRATYHDPCYLGRYCDMYETPRDVIRSSPGVELVEMERNRMDAWCCGAGGGVRVGKKDYAVATGRERVDEAISSGADLLVTSCPNCLENLWEARGKGKSPLAIQDIATLIGQSLIT